MKVIYVSSACSPERYSELIESKGLRNQQQSQKYNYLMAEGLAANDVNVEMLSIRPINRATEKKVFFGSSTEKHNRLLFQYVAFLNLPVLRNISVFLSIFISLLFKKYHTSDVILCDALNISASAAVVCASKIRGLKTCAIVTDVPSHRATTEPPRLYEKINLYYMKRFKGYLLLTEEMDKVVNPRHMPHIVMEGLCDAHMKTLDNDLKKKYNKKVCIYAGMTMKMYGIAMLVQGFLDARVDDAELHIYGSGDYDDELKTISREHGDLIQYKGIAPNEQIVAEEMKAWLLINPRPTDEDFTKFSFPSKNMEYMASGTPILTTRLPGMPKEYEAYCFFIEEENARGVRQALERVFSNSLPTLHEFGDRAKRFVLAEKNNVVQANKVKSFLESLS